MDVKNLRVPNIHTGFALEIIESSITFYRKS